ncbi:Ca(2+)-dependent cysteine protease [Ceratobasidium sp. UAMH 11750]|nr:Ca(2+)-dependent cysteine protease [Ceratobasidium sp. UAMH 11750]
MPQRNRRASRSAPGKRHSLNAMFARLGLTQRTEWTEQGSRFPLLLTSEPVTAPDTAMDETCCFAQEPDQPGRRRALLIAIQYEGQCWSTSGTTMHLGGPYEDAQDIRNLLIEQGYDPQDIQLMTDKPGTEQHNIPTRDNIKMALQRLVAEAKRNDRFFLFFAGHGTQVDDEDGDEEDGKDEGIIPCDWATSFDYKDDGIIIDDYLRDTCVDPLPEGSQLIGVFDSCHAGTILDLPEQYPEREHLPADSDRLSLRVFETNGSQLRVYGKVGARVICFAACTDPQNAYGKKIGQQLRGRFTRAFAQNVRKLCSGGDGKRNPAVQELYDSIAEQLNDEKNDLKGKVQTPLLTTSFTKLADDWQKPIEF